MITINSLKILSILQSLLNLTFYCHNFGQYKRYQIVLNKIYHHFSFNQQCLFISRSTTPPTHLSKQYSSKILQYLQFPIQQQTSKLTQKMRSNHLDEFQIQFKKKIVMEWYQAYVDYIEIKKQLLNLKEIYDQHHDEYFLRGNQYTHLLELEPSNKDKYRRLLLYCEKLLEIGEQKFWAFYMYKKYQIAYFCQELEQVMHELSKTEILTHNSCVQRYYLKSAIKLIYANCHYLKNYIAFNLQIVAKVSKRTTAYRRILENANQINRSEMYQMSEIDQPAINLNKLRKNSVKSSSDIFEDSSSLHQETKFLTSIQQNVKELYLQLIFHNEEKFHRLDQRIEDENKKNSDKTYILVGFFCGMSIISFLAILLLLFLGLIKPEYNMDDIDSMAYVFPMFRGVGLFILYLWGIAWNVYGFTKYRISYRKILKYGSHYSTYMIIIKRASFFSLIFCLMLLLYFVGNTYNQDHDRDLNLIPVQYTPFVVWILYLGYIFFPNRDVFNPQGRKYFYRAIKDVLMSPCGKVTFLISWLTDQTVSFIIPIKDMAYTICFYTTDFSNNNLTGPQQCLDKTSAAGILITYLIALFPLIFRMIQCFRQAKQDKNGELKGNFIGHTQMWNFGKYAASLITATISYLTVYFDNLIIYLVVSSICSTIYAYIWDLKNDWGFLQKSSKHQFLRNYLSYQKSYFYYIAICINLLFRMSWTLSLSAFVQKQVKSELLPLILGIMEISRRCMWNFFRIQKQHIMNCRSFAVTENIEDKINHIKTINHELAQQQKQEAVDNAVLTQSIPYLYRNSQQNFLDMKLLPEESEIIIKKEELTQNLQKFRLKAQHEKRIKNLGKDRVQEL